MVKWSLNMVVDYDTELAVWRVLWSWNHVLSSGDPVTDSKAEEDNKEGTVKGELHAIN